MTRVKIVLSSPLTGALHWWLAHDLGLGDQSSKQPGHPYYRQVYGDVDANLDLALACSVLFEDVVVAGVDAPYPNFVGDWNSGLRFPALDLSVDTEVMKEASEILRRVEDDLLADKDVALLLEDVQEHGRHTELLYAISDVLLSDRLGCSVLCSGGRQQLVVRLIEMGAVSVDSRIQQQIAGHGLLETLRDYTQIVGPTFRNPTPGSLSAVKGNAKVRDYASHFQDALTSSRPMTSDALFELIESTQSSKDLADNVSGAFSASSRVMALLSLIPIFGTLAGGASVAGDASSVAAARRAESLRWFELGNEIQSFHSMEMLRRALEAR